MVAKKKLKMRSAADRQAHELMSTMQYERELKIVVKELAKKYKFEIKDA